MTVAAERITTPALRTPMGLVVTLPPPARHPCTILAMRRAGIEWDTIVDCEQGFLTSAVRFVGREDAFEIACVAGQVSRDHPMRILHCEDLW